MRLVIVGGGPAGAQAATNAARLGVGVTLIERDVIGGAANLRDCIPSKAMIATGGAMSFLHRAGGMGLDDVDGQLDLERLRQRIVGLERRLEEATVQILESQQVELVRGTGWLAGSHEVVADTVDGERRFQADAILVEHREPPPDPPVGRSGRGPGPHDP